MADTDTTIGDAVTLLESIDLNDSSHRRGPNHGDSRTRLYGCWGSMRGRCRNPNNVGYARYGGRGIDVCAEWDAWRSFKAWALANGYTDDLTIDRIDNDGNYEPGNCQWITRSSNISKSHVDSPRLKHGADNPNAKLTAKQVRLIKAIYSTGDYQAATLATIFKMSSSGIKKVIEGAAWV